MLLPFLCKSLSPWSCQWRTSNYFWFGAAWFELIFAQVNLKKIFFNEIYLWFNCLGRCLFPLVDFETKIFFWSHFALKSLLKSSASNRHLINFDCADESQRLHYLTAVCDHSCVSVAMDDEQLLLLLWQGRGTLPHHVLLKAENLITFIYLPMG